MSEFLLTREVAELLRAPESTVRYWRHIRIGPPSVKVGRRVLYRRAAVLAWLVEQEHLAQGTPATFPAHRNGVDLIAERVRRHSTPRPKRAPG